MSRMGALVLSAVVGAVAFLGVNQILRDGPDGSIGTGPGISQERCIRQFDGLDVIEETAGKICGCMLAEFDNRGIKVTDAFVGGYDEMKQITRNCGQNYGITLN